MAQPSTRGPRLPLDSAPRPRYAQDRRVGCSGIALVSVGALLAFLVFSVIITPRIMDQVRGFSLPGVLGLQAQPTATPAPTAAAPAAATLVPTPVIPAPAADTPEPTPAVLPSATPEPEYVAIGNSAGDNVSLRAAPRVDAHKLLALAPRTVLLVVGDDTNTDGKLWRNVSTTQGDPVTGWVMAQYLVPATPP